MFVNTTDESLLEGKQDMFLVLAGLKPVSEAISGHWVDTTDGREVVADDPAAVRTFLGSLGLAYHLESDHHYTQVQVALQQGLVEQYREAVKHGPKGARQAGHLFGYPASAIEAFERDECLDGDRQVELEREAGIPEHFVPFRYSRQHWNQELQTAVLWYQTLKAYGLA